MKKSDLINKVAKQTKLTRSEAGEAINKFLELVKTSLAEGETIYIRGFGSFELKKSNKTKARDLQKNIMIEIPERFLPVFKPYGNFLELIDEKQKKSS